MQVARLLLGALIPCLLMQVVLPQELPFDIPVQLIGFPVIILAVRISNFLKKLSYAINPSTYRSRARRGSDHAPLDIVDIEKKLINEMGDSVCVYEDVCTEYAEKVNHDQNFVLDWQDIFRHYEKFPRGKKEFYLLSVFMGDIVKSKELCSQLAKRGRSCNSEHSVNSETHPVIKHQAEANHQNDNVKPELGHQNSFAERLGQEVSTQHQTSTEVKHQHHITSHKLKAQQSNQSAPLQLNVSQVHQQIHRHHVEIHSTYDANHQIEALLTGQNPSRHMHHQSKRVNS